MRVAGSFTRSDRTIGWHLRRRPDRSHNEEFLEAEGAARAPADAKASDGAGSFLTDGNFAQNLLLDVLGKQQGALLMT